MKNYLMKMLTRGKKKKKLEFDAYKKILETKKESQRHDFKNEKMGYYNKENN